MFSDDKAAGQMKFDGQVLSDDMRGKFRTKSLRHVELTAPYMHDGSLATLEDVVTFYNDGGGATGFPGAKDPLLVPLNLTTQEIQDLVAFLKSLTGEPVPAALTVNTSAP
jgi:cytochrome c peroxidase